jgi:ABC-type Fe3+/spermidine/putrescine transport system ATPase subunit
VTHDQEEALTMSDRIAVMNQGRIEQIGTPAEVYEQPLTRFVSDFIGVCNFLHGTVRGRSDGAWVVETEHGLVLRVGTSRPVSPGQPVTVAIRPEKVQLGQRPPEGRLNRACARIEHVVYLGTMTQYHLVTTEGHRLIAFAQNVHPLQAEPAARANDTVFLSWTAEASQVLLD